MRISISASNSVASISLKCCVPPVAGDAVDRRSNNTRNAPHQPAAALPTAASSRTSRLPFASNCQRLGAFTVAGTTEPGTAVAVLQGVKNLYTAALAGADSVFADGLDETILDINQPPLDVLPGVRSPSRDYLWLGPLLGLGLWK
jgi:hypothetical protein